MYKIYITIYNLVKQGKGIFFKKFLEMSNGSVAE